MVDGDRFSWQMSLYAAAVAILTMLLLFVYAADPLVSYLFLIVPIICLVIFVLLFVIAFSSKRRRRSSMLLGTVTFLLVTGAMLMTQEEIRPSLRWLLWSRTLKAQVLSQSTTSNDELKHIEWDGWGGAPVGDWTAYVVYDPGDSLSAAAKKGQRGIYKRLRGIPCEVDSVRRLEPHWYSVVLGMNEWWERCGTS